MVAGWIGMIGLALVLHFGLFHLMSLTWQAAGVDAKPLMQKPLNSRSLADLWGRRWNTGFNAIARELLFEPLVPRIGAVAATGVVFFASGVIHDLVISLPARGGYGLPTLYFMIQFVGLLVERTSALRRVRRSRILAWLYVAAVALLPAVLLFHPPFVKRVIIPFLHAIGGLP
jgi:alginate O-acetyltransferase complex protein AlgI